LAAWLALWLCGTMPGLAREAPVWAQPAEMERHRLCCETAVPGPERAAFVELEVTVDESGAVVETRPGRGLGTTEQRDPQLLALAREAVRPWRFRPFARDGRPAPGRGFVAVQVRPAERSPTRHVAFPDGRSADVVIRLIRRSGIFVTPSYSVTIRGDGRVRFEAERGTLIDGNHDYRIPAERIDALVARFRAADFWSLDPVQRGVSDVEGTWQISFSLGDRSKTVVDHIGPVYGRPRALDGLERAIDEAAETARWTRGDAGSLAAIEAEGFDFRSSAAAAMLVAAMDGAPDAMMHGLMERGAPLDRPPACRDGPYCPPGRTYREQALNQAIRFGRLALFDRLGTDRFFARLDQRTKDRMLMAAAEQRSPHLVRGLLARGASAAATDPELGTALRRALFENWQPAPDADRAAVVDLLLAAGAPIEARDNFGSTALQYSSDTEPGIVRRLIAAGANVDAGRDSGNPPLLYRTDDEDIALIALAAGADRGLRDGERRSLPEIARDKRWQRVDALLRR
jgi:hypothetical protein